MSGKRVWGAAVVPILAAWFTPPLWGQAIRGRLIEAETNQPIPQAQVALLASTGNAVAVAQSNLEGRFALRAPRPGAYRVQVRRLGFQPRWVPIDVGGDGVELDVRLAPIPVTLDPVVIEADLNLRYLERVGFYHRQIGDFGHFITRDEIESRRATRITDVLSMVPGVRLLPDGTRLGRMLLQFRNAQSTFGGICEPRVFVDGLIAIRGSSKPVVMTPGGGIIDELNQEDPRSPEPAVDDVVDPRDIEAIEVYRSGAAVPAQFGGMGPYTRCGVVVVWTRRGR
ncbi:MAG TPA: carboxypeptidase regulatory-like domain-containing protein [Gemmatimonadales bacterium]|nr:carboxypeptidase regulatory-like domain-containing protein [Gemmatimonadales bacterium]